jgi:cyclic pyranopterin phosphate synthase
MQKETLRRIMDRQIEKGDVLGVAQTAGIMAAKKTAELIPMCHPLSITSIEMEFLPHEAASQIEVRAQVKITGKTGVEMEALVAVSVASLTVYDMCKAIDRGITISDIKLISKSGGKSGRYERPSI